MTTRRAADPLDAILRRLAACDDPPIARWARKLIRSAAARRRREKAARVRKPPNS
jgi:hypothetical protein